MVDRSKPRKKLYRYTNLAAAIHLLRSRKITLLNPDTWDDKNDVHYMQEYKRVSGATNVLAICFSTVRETYHHWRVFSGGSDGVRIEFDREKLLEMFDSAAGTFFGRMQYHTINELKDLSPLAGNTLPFVKRKPYKPEGEFRVVYRGADKGELKAKDYPIELPWISRITLSPWMPEAFKGNVRATLRSIPGCEQMSIVQSTLTGNSEWKSITSQATAAVFNEAPLSSLPG